MTSVGGKDTLVTGTSAGIGAAIAERLVKEGAIYIYKVIYIYIYIYILHILASITPDVMTSDQEPAPPHSTSTKIT